MARHVQKISLILIPVLILVGCIAVDLPTDIVRLSDGGVANVSLSEYDSSNKEDQAFVKLAIIDGNANSIIRINNIPPEVTFVIVQVHAYLYNVTISFETASFRSPGNFVTGTNIGLLVETNSSPKAVIYVSNNNNFEINSMIAVVAYTHNAPFPGGCNMEFDVERSPFQKLVYDEATITVDAQPASIPRTGSFQPLCEKYPLQHEAYRMYMPEQDPSNETYFLAIANMLTVRDMKKNGEFVPVPMFGSPMRRVYSAYPGTGSVFGMLTYFSNFSSAYVPIVSYGCDATSWSTSCSDITAPFARVLLALTFFLGLFVAVQGFYYFRTSMFLMGMLAGGYVGYSLSVYSGAPDFTGLMLTTILAGVVTSLVWLLLWTTFSSPIPCLMLSGLTLGSFLFFLFYYTVPGDLFYLEFDYYFWMLYSTFVVLVILIFTIIPLVGNIICFTTLGAYATVFSIDYYTGSNLKYILINGIRRATVPNFNVAVIQPPYQEKDVLLTFFWIFLVILGLYKQCAYGSNRAPYPPSAPGSSNVTERAPLLGGRRYQYRYRSYNNERSDAERPVQGRFYS